MKTEVSRANGITAIWFDGRVLSAWHDDTGEGANLFAAHSITRFPVYPAPPVPGFPGEDGPVVNDSPSLFSSEPICAHGLPSRLCMKCGNGPNLWGLLDA